jgi:hypothetical protein
MSDWVTAALSQLEATDNEPLSAEPGSEELEGAEEPEAERGLSAMLQAAVAALVLGGLIALPAFMRKLGPIWRPRADYRSVDSEKPSDILEPLEAGPSTACPICGDQAGRNSSCWNCINVSQVSEEAVQA